MRAVDDGLGCCRVCHQIVSFPPVSDGEPYTLCPRCGSTVTPRIPDSSQKVWALLVASIILYIPANVLPMTHSSSLTGVESDTILSGVLYFLEHGAWLIAFVIFVASIVVPLGKILVLIYLLISLRRPLPLSTRRKERLHALTEIVGRWSMVDIFVVSIMTTVVQFGALGRIRPGSGALFFLAVVILTMIAAMQFDPRKLWDKGAEHARS